ncbi:MAG: excinuclease ABC subunit UvrA, partial [Anaerolineales bacterium]|nr:excinuclease ABC subunit UvrA [Anaerolineales bacterium]
PLNLPIKKLKKEQLDLLLYGSRGEKVPVRYTSRDGRQATWDTVYEGIIPNLKRRYEETTSEYIREKIQGFMSDRPCEACGGARLRKEALAVTLGAGEQTVNIITVTAWAVLHTLDWAKSLKATLSARDQKIAAQILKEIMARLQFLVDVGLDYLTLNRTAATLSGGEAQRIRLATQIGSQLMGVLYVLDEPSIGLHQRDNARLIKTLQNMRDLGNTLLVVEHDDETILAADWVVDLGPGAGEHGGQLIFEGTVPQLLKDKKSLTGAYLSGRLKIEMPAERRPGNGKHLLVRGARENNLKGIDVDIPLGKFVCLTGVSGSGKSSLLVEVVYKRLAQLLHSAHEHPGAHASLEGWEHIDKIINIDQSPIGRTPRSNPATYVGIFDEIRTLFSELPEAKVRGYKSGRFSFNVKGGRCEACQGQGQVQIEMQFLPDIFVPCEVCHGARYNRETLQVHFKGKQIAEVLDLTVDEALGFFTAQPGLKRKLTTLSEVGLGYVRLGQPATTLSGGEAQRTKLAKELSRRSTGKTLYVLDEPSVGLHAADVHKLVEVLQRFVDEGNTVLIIEHHMDIIKVADWLIDLGPEGGDRGGYLVAEGTPEEIARVKGSYTGQFLKKYLNQNGAGKKK